MAAIKSWSSKVRDREEEVNEKKKYEMDPISG